MFYFFNVQNLMTQQSEQHIYEVVTDGYIVTFPYSDDNPNKQRVDAWIAEGNTLEEWQPASEPASEPVIEETPADSTDEEPVTEDAN
jgi:hypothetical protein